MRDEKRKFYIFIAFVLLFFVSPVSADVFNDYYRVAPTINPGATVFIGEQGLDITGALSAHPGVNVIGWWASAADIGTTSPTVSYNLTNRATSFTVTQVEFDGYEGEWYQVNPTTSHAYLPAVFNIKAPKLNMTVRDPMKNDGADVSGTSIPIGTKLQFQIDSNIYTVLNNPSLRRPVYNSTGGGTNSDGFLDIMVRYENGTTFTQLYDDNNLGRTLVALNVSVQPFTWGRANAGTGPGIVYVWNTSTYPTGTYVVTVQSKLNNMQTNYVNGSAPYIGRTVSEAKTVTLVGNLPPADVSTQIGIFRPVNGNWYLDTTMTGVVNKTFHFGTSGDVSVVGDWDGNGVSDVGVFRQSNGNWYLDTTKTGVINKTFHFGTTGDIPVVGDWDGNGIADVGVFRQGNGNWYLDTTKTGVVNKTFHFGTSGDIPVVGNWTLGTTNIGVFRNSSGNWYLDTTKTGVVNKSFHFGTLGDIAVVGDWNGDGISDAGVFRPSSGNWYLDTTKTGVVATTFHFGTNGDIPVVGDWDGNGISDVGVFRPASGNWYLDTTKTGTVNKSFHFGTTGDTPVVGKWI